MSPNLARLRGNGVEGRFGERLRLGCISCSAKFYFEKHGMVPSKQQQISLCNTCVFEVDLLIISESDIKQLNFA